MVTILKEKSALHADKRIVYYEPEKVKSLFYGNHSDRSETAKCSSRLKPAVDNVPNLRLRVETNISVIATIIIVCVSLRHVITASSRMCSAWKQSLRGWIGLMVTHQVQHPPTDRRSVSRGSKGYLRN